MRTFNVFALLSLLTVLGACGHPLVFGANSPETTNPEGNSDTPGDTDSGETAATPDQPLAEGERPTGKLNSFAQVVGTLPSPVAHSASLQIGNKVYVFGGVKADPDGSSNPTTTTQILVSTIDATGNLGSFSVSPYVTDAARRAMRAVRIGDWAYLIGGYSNSFLTDSVGGGTLHTSIERAPIVNNELAGNFSVVAGKTLVVNRTNFALLKTNNYVYAIGGTSQGSTIDRAPISGGEISGTFTTLTRTVVTPGSVVSNGMVVPRYTHDVTVIGDTAYIVGGAATAGHASLNSIEEVEINADGTLGDFTLISPTIGQERNRIIVAGLQDDVYVFAGWDSGFLTSVYSTTLVGGKITTNFTSAPGVTLAAGVENGVSLLTRAAMYYMGGYNNSSGARLYNYVQRAEISP